jgi:translation initiation factor IF-2
MSTKLNKVVKELNVGLSTAVEFLHKKGFSDVESNPNARISDEQYDLLVNEFSKDKSQKIESGILAQRNKERAKGEVVALEGFDNEVKPVEEIKIEIQENSRPQFKQVGKIDLDALKPKKKEPVATIVVPVETKQAVQPEPAEEVKEPEIVKIEEEVVSPIIVTETKVEEEVEEKIEVEMPIAIEELTESPVVSEDGIYTIEKNTIHSTINVVGRIDLDALNQQTRPKKKTKEEKKKERLDREVPKPAPTVVTAPKDAVQKEAAAAADKKKRSRIQRERVNIYDPNAQAKKPTKPQPQGAGNKEVKKFVPKEQISDEDIQKQVKETLARLTNKGKSKGAKYRKDKREAVSQRMQEEADLERLDSRVIKITEFVTANELATMMDVPVTQVIGTCMSIGIMVSINQRLDAETINIVAEEFGFKTEYVSAEVAQAIHVDEDAEEDLLPRAPIVTVMGHVDHGKTSLLDYVRNANVIAGEAGGITQHIGAYNVTLENGQKITFLDTPGHEAFTAMRARGAKVTDIAIIIVAADDDVMPQTIEAINHAAAANVPMVFAINKVDKPNANPEKIKEALAGMNYLVEEWGGKYQSHDISAKQGLGIKELLEKVLLEAELLELKANPNKKAIGSIIESSLDKGRGYVSTVLVQAGTLKMGDVVIAGTHFGKIKAMFNERNQRITEAKPSEPVLILGLNGAPQAGDEFHVLETEQEARDIANKREQLQREQSIRTKKHLTLDELGRRIALGNFQELNVIVKGDVDGSIEALSDSLIKLSTPEIQVNVIHKAVGAISESDIMLATASNAIVVGFQVRPSIAARRLAENEGIDIRLYSIIYDAIEEIKSAMEGMLSPEIKEVVTATLEIMEVFKITKVGHVAGCLVREGKIKRANKIRLIRDGIVIYSGQLGSLKRMKEDVKEVALGYECGLNIGNYNDLRVGDMIESFEEVEIKKTL